MIKETKFKGYFVSEQGDVYSTWWGSKQGRVQVPMHLLKQRVDSKGRTETLRIGGQRIRAYQLVYETFVGPMGDYMIDHIDRNPANNSLSNLRLVTPQQNCQNMSIRSDNSSGHKGVYFNKKLGAYCAKIKVEGQHKYLGQFSTAQEAGQAYDEAAIIHFKQYAATNKEIV